MRTHSLKRPLRDPAAEEALPRLRSDDQSDGRSEYGRHGAILRSNNVSRFYFSLLFGFRPEQRGDCPRDDLLIMIGCTGPAGKMALQMGASHTRWLSLLRQRDAGNTRTGVYTPYIKLPLSASS